MNELDEQIEEIQKQAAPKAVAKPVSPYIIFMKSLKQNEDFQESLKNDSIVKGSFLVEASKKWKEMSD